MDSGNTSGSLQSSSGGDEEYDSRAAAAAESLFFNNNARNDVVQQQQNQNQSLFDPLSNFLDYSTSNNMIWGRAVRSDPTPPDLVSAAGAPSSDHLVTHTARSPLPNLQPPIHMGSIPIAGGGGGSSSSTSGPAEKGGAAVNPRNPKKRSRASRRAPTTVLTTDTSNFRAMVQEFTGIPAPPFASSPFPRTRFDLFGSASGLRTGHVLDHLAASSSSSSSTSPMASAATHTTPYSLLRPYAQKVQQTTSFMGNASPASNPVGYNLLNRAPASHPGLSFNNLLQPPLKFPAPQPKSNIAAALQDHQTTSFGLQSLTAATEAASWASAASADFGILSSNDNSMNVNDNGSGMADEGFLRSINGGYGGNSSERQQQVVANGKGNYTAAAAAEFCNNKGSENVASRTEGMVESWICSSD